MLNSRSLRAEDVKSTSTHHGDNVIGCSSDRIHCTVQAFSDEPTDHNDPSIESGIRETCTNAQRAGRANARRESVRRNSNCVARHGATASIQGSRSTIRQRLSRTWQRFCCGSWSWHLHRPDRGCWCIGDIYFLAAIMIGATVLGYLWAIFIAILTTYFHI